MYKFFQKEISGPFTIPSGVITTEVPVLQKIAEEVPEIGILTTKSIGIEPKEGNKEPILSYYSPFSYINAVGLRNPGAENFARQLIKLELPPKKFLLISIFGGNREEFLRVAEILFPYADGFELNISCPHSKNYGQSFGKDIQEVAKAVRAVADLGKPVMVKISPNLDIEKTVKEVIRAGANGITAINTKGPVEYAYKENPVLSNGKGGISGKEILETGVSCVEKIKKITDLPIIACGGIFGAKDALRYKSAGAENFGVGSALAGMSTERIKSYFSRLIKDMENSTDNASTLLMNNADMIYQEAKIKKREELAPDLFYLETETRIEAGPGQYVFLWLPGVGERPFSVLDNDPLSFFVKKRGVFTKALAEIKEGETIFFRGPYGKIPQVEGKILLVGGGTGIAALYLFSKNYKNTVAVLGAKNKDHLFYERFKDKCNNLYLFTEDGSIGEKGKITGDLVEVIKKERPDYCINCGPLAMVEGILPKQKKYVDKERIFSSIEFPTRCGKGLCGACATSKGYRSCVDGTFLTPDQI